MGRDQNDRRVQMSRREMIAGVAGAGLGLASMIVGNPARAQSNAGPVETPPLDPRFGRTSSWKTELRKLAPNVYAYIQAGGLDVGSGAGISNAGVVVGDDHVMVIDTLGQPFHVKALIAAMKPVIGGKPVGRVVNTHQHNDHVAGNWAFMPVEIVSHPFCQQMVREMAAAIPPGTKYEKVAGASDGTELRRHYPATTTFTDRLTYRYGTATVELIHPGIGHTWGDVLAYIPEQKILFIGDDAVFSMTPWTHQGHVSKWLEAIDRILAMDVEVIVPGHGPIGGKKEVEEMRDYFVLLKREARKRFDAGMSPGKAAAEIPFGKYNNWVGAERNLLNTVRMYAEFDGTITPMLDLVAMKKATDEYNAIQKSKKA